LLKVSFQTPFSPPHPPPRRRRRPNSQAFPSPFSSDWRFLSLSCENGTNFFLQVNPFFLLQFCLIKIVSGLPPSTGVKPPSESSSSDRPGVFLIRGSFHRRRSVTDPSPFSEKDFFLPFHSSVSAPGYLPDRADNNGAKTHSPATAFFFFR